MIANAAKRKVIAAGKPATVDSYFTWVRRHPLKAIRTEGDLDASQSIVDELVSQDLDVGETAYLDALSDLILLYERDAHPMSAVAPHRRLAHLLDVNGLTQSEFARRTGYSKATVSDLVSGKRPFTVSQMTRIAAEFALPASAFLPGPTR